VNDRPISVRIDRVVLRNIDDTAVGGLSDLVAERLRADEGPAVSGPIPRTGRAMVESAADRIARSVRQAVERR
jgi:hypothetical protein